MSYKTLDGLDEIDASKQCIQDESKQKDYLGPLDLHLYLNQETFDKTSYDSDSITLKSKIVSFQMSQNIPQEIDLEL